MRETFAKTFSEPMYFNVLWYIYIYSTKISFWSRKAVINPPPLKKGLAQKTLSLESKFNPTESKYMGCLAQAIYYQSFKKLGARV